MPKKARIRVGRDIAGEEVAAPEAVVTVAQAGWREPAAAESDLFAVLVQADFALRELVARQLTGALVRQVHCSGLESLDIQPAANAVALSAGHPPTLLDIEGRDTAGRHFTASLHAASGYVTRLDVSPSDPYPLEPLDLTTLTQLDAVPRGTLELYWLVPRTAPILGRSR
jgi:hypothetical protein